MNGWMAFCWSEDSSMFLKITLEPLQNKKMTQAVTFLKIQKSKTVAVSGPKIKHKTDKTLMIKSGSIGCTIHF